MMTRNQRAFEADSGTVKVMIREDAGTILVPDWPYADSTPRSMDILWELADQTVDLLKKFMQISKTGNSALATSLLKQVESYFTRTLRVEVTGRQTGATQSTSLSSTEERVAFGMSESTIKRLWDNEADRYWDGL